MSDSTGETGFAERLRELKDRSGHSYGMLAKRLHMSTSTLHRYCNGEAVPTDYAPVERMARLCGASPAELVALHRSWVLADAGRGRKAAGGDAGSRGGEVAAAGAVEEAGGGPGEGVSETGAEGAAGETPAGAVSGGTGGAGALGEEAAAREAASGEAATREAAASGKAAVVGGEAAVVGGAAAVAGDTVSEGSGQAPTTEPVSQAAPTPAPEAAVPRSRLRPRRPALVAVLAGAAVLGAVAVAFALPGGGSHDQGAAPGATVSDPAPATGTGTGPRRRPSPSPSGSAGHPSPSATRGNAGGLDAAPSGPPGGATADGAESTAAPLAITTHPYSWESPCSQHYLIDRPPADVSPPPVENDAPAWVAVHQAVSAGEQFVTLTVQGSGKQTVVLEGMSVRMAGKRAPLAWNDYAMGYPGVGCGGGVPTHSFTVALDAVRPAVQPVAGQRGFPLSVSESDPEVFYVTANASAYDVSWYLELSWSSGGRHGTLEIGDKGRPFRTSGSNGRPAYAFPLGGEKWAPAQ
ncbi:helix-turn-helix domain-containing protein [Streptomyces sp. AM6-12]|uniref:helix-turn-helix domain-containing protein n=1 Tax=Streptomyces sp. AM6-12 TaxID=3345149 RepID=UPI00378F87DD